MKVLDKVTNQFIEVPDLLQMHELYIGRQIKNDGINGYNCVFQEEKFTIRNLGEAFNRFTIAESTFDRDEIRIIKNSLYDFGNKYDFVTAIELIDKLTTEEIKIERFDEIYINDIKYLKKENEKYKQAYEFYRDETIKHKGVIENYEKMFKGNVFKVIYKCIKHFRGL